MESTILSTAQIRDLNSQGHKLDESGSHLYVQSFLINSEQNAAADPEPFKIKPSFLKELTETAIGRPWIPETLPNGMHIRPFNGATAEEIIEYQKDFAGGEMVASYVNPETNNASVIIDIFPEYRTAVRKHKIKPFVSPMLGNWNKDENGEVYRGEILHLQSVDTSGYNPAYAKFSETCQGSLNQCMAELRPIAASGRLGSWRKKNSSTIHLKKFSNTTSPPIGVMSMPDPNIPVPGAGAPPDSNGAGDNIAQQVGELIQKEQALEEKVSEIELVEEEIKSTVEKVQSEVSEIKVAVNKIAGNGKEDDEETDDDSDDDSNDDDDKTKPPAGAAAKQLLRTPEYKKLAKEHSDLKRRFELQEKETLKKLNDFNEKERKRQAVIIVKSELLQRKIAPDKKDERIKYYIELKDSAEKLRDISLLAEESEKNIFETFPESASKEEPSGAYGGMIDDLPFSGTAEPDYSEIEKEILGD